MFKLDLKTMRASGNSEAYVRVWLTNWQNKLTTEELEIAKRHQILWYGQQAQMPAGYPLLGIPGSKEDLLLVAQTGKLGPEHMDLTQIDDAAEVELLTKISGKPITEANKDSHYYELAGAQRNAMDKFRHFATVALGESLNGAFDQGILRNYNQLIKWVYKKCNITKSTESMSDYFKELDQAINMEGDIDCRILKYRMVLNKLYTHGSRTDVVQFPDIEDDPIIWTRKEEYSPIQSMLFLFNIWKKTDAKSWQNIEDEFRSELGGVNYTKANWMKNKPRLFELIDQKAKSNTSRSSINVVQEQDEDEDKLEIEIEPGVIMYIAPKGPKKSRPQNWKQKVQKYQAAAKRGQRSNNDKPKSSWNNNGNNTPAQYWNCRFCPPINNRPVRHNRGQKCPKNNFIPQRMIAVVQTQNEEPKEEEKKEEIAPPTGQLMAFKHQTNGPIYYDSSADDSDI